MLLAGVAVRRNVLTSRKLPLVRVHTLVPSYSAVPILRRF